MGSKEGAREGSWEACLEEGVGAESRRQAEWGGEAGFGGWEDGRAVPPGPGPGTHWRPAGGRGFPGILSLGWRPEEKEAKGGV